MHRIWLGSEDSYFQAQAALTKIENYKVSHPNADMGEDEDIERPSNYLNVVDGVGIITVEGPLVEGVMGIMGKWFGITGYGDIAQAAIEAVKNPLVNSIMLSVRSGGGTVAGVQEVANFLADVDKLKPVMTYTPTIMASAALWLGLAARKVVAAETSMVGSIGTLQVLASRHRQLQEEGIDAVVIRSGEKKALGHPVDAMSDEAKMEAQDTVNYMAKLFLTHVADRRGTTLQVAERKYGDGRVFIGAQALDAGLVDQISTYSEAFGAAKELGPKTDNKVRVFGGKVAATAEAGDNPVQAKGQDMPTTHIPSASELAAMMAASAGIPEAAAPGAPATTAPEASAPEVTADTTTADAAAQVVALTAQLGEFTTKLTATEAALAESATKLEALEKQLQEANLKAAAVDSLAAIVTTNMKGMKIALGGSAKDIEGVAVTELAAAHTELTATFKSKFKAGGVAAASTETEAPQGEAVKVNPLFLAAAQLKQTNQRK